MIKRVALTVIGLAIVGLFAAPVAEACMVRPCPIGCSFLGVCFCPTPEAVVTGGFPDQAVVTEPGTTTLTFIDETHVRVRVAGYATTNITDISECVVAVSPISGIESVDRITNLNSETFEQLAGVSFYPSDRPATAVSKLALDTGVPMESTSPWFSFESHITGSIPEGVPNHFDIEVTLQDGVTALDFINAVRSQGFFLTSSAHDGVPSTGHQDFFPMGDGGLVIEIADPASPERDSEISLH